MKYRIVQWLGRNIFPREGICMTVYPDVKLLLHPRDWIEYLMLRGEKYEPHTLDFLSANLNAGDVALLAGVNFGLHAAVAARAVTEKGTVLGIEPQPASIVRAKENLVQNGLLNQVKIVTAALGAQDGFADMAWAPSGNTGAASLLDKGAGLVVPLVAPARLFETVEKRMPRLFLLDVEGYEMFVLNGFGGTFRPEIIVVEVLPKLLERSQATPRQLLEKIVALGYSLCDLAGVAASVDRTEFLENNVVGVQPGCAVNWLAGNPKRHGTL